MQHIPSLFSCTYNTAHFKPSITDNVSIPAFFSVWMFCRPVPHHQPTPRYWSNSKYTSRSSNLKFYWKLLGFGEIFLLPFYNYCPFTSCFSSLPPLVLKQHAKLSTFNIHAVPFTFCFMCIGRERKAGWGQYCRYELQALLLLHVLTPHTLKHQCKSLESTVQALYLVTGAWRRTTLLALKVTWWVMCVSEKERAIDTVRVKGQRCYCLTQHHAVTTQMRLMTACVHTVCVHSLHRSSSDIVYVQ